MPFNHHRLQNGAALVVVLILTVIISTVTIAMANKSKTDIMIANNDQRVKQALFVANAGLSHAFQYLENHQKSTSNQNLNNELDSNGIGGALADFGTDTKSINGTQYRVMEFGDGDYFVRIEDNFDDNDQDTDIDNQVWFKTIGQVDSSEREIHALIRSGISAPGIFGKTSLLMTGSSEIDSYPGGTYNSAVAENNATVGSNVNVSVSGSLDLMGDIESGGTISTSGSGSSVSGTSSTGAAEVVLPSVEPCSPYSTDAMTGYNPANGNINLNGSDELILGAGNYCFNNISLSANSRVTSLDGDRVSITINGVLDMSGGEISNQSKDAAFFSIRSSYSGPVLNNLRGGSNGFFTLYAPDARVEIRGNADINGTVIANELELSGSGAVHVDSTLTTIAEFEILGWREVRSAK